MSVSDLCLFVCLYISARSSVCLSARLPAFLAVSLSVFARFTVCLSVSQPACLRVSIYLFLNCLSVCKLSCVFPCLFI